MGFSGCSRNKFMSALTNLLVLDLNKIAYLQIGIQLLPFELLVYPLQHSLTVLILGIIWRKSLNVKYPHHLLLTDLRLEDGLHLYLVSGALGRDGPAPGVGPQLVGLLGLHLHWDRVPCHTTVRHKLEYGVSRNVSNIQPLSSFKQLATFKLQLNTFKVRARREIEITDRDSPYVSCLVQTLLPTRSGPPPSLLWWGARVQECSTLNGVHWMS